MVAAYFLVRLVLSPPFPSLSSAWRTRAGSSARAALFLLFPSPGWLAHSYPAMFLAGHNIAGKKILVSQLD